MPPGYSSIFWNNRCCKLHSLCLLLKPHTPTRTLGWKLFHRMKCISGPLLAMPMDIQKGGFTQRTNQMFSVLNTPKEFKRTGHFGFVFEENSGREITWLSWVHRFRKPPFSKCFRPHQDAQPVLSNIFGLRSAFEKLLLRDGLVWTVGLTVEIKLRFRDGLVWTVGLTVEIKLRFHIFSGVVGGLKRCVFFFSFISGTWRSA